MLRRFFQFSDFRSFRHVVWSQVYRVRWQSLSLTPEHKTRFYFPLQRLDQILDGTYKANQGWYSKWKSFLKQFHKLRIEQIRGMLYVCAKRGLMPQDIWHNLTTVHWTGPLSEAKGSDLASILHSLALLNQSRQLRKGRGLSEPFMKSVLRRALERNALHRFSTVSLSQCLYSFAVLQLRGHPLVSTYSAQICSEHRRETFTTQCLANVLWSWAKLDYVDASHLEILSEMAIQQRQEANAQELTNILWSWYSLGHRSPEHWTPVLEEIQRRRRELMPQGIALLFIACARIEHQNDDSCRVILRHVVEPKEHILFSNSILANIIWSLGKIQLSDDNASVTICIVESLKVSRLEKYTSQELCSVTLGIARIDFRDLDLCLELHKEIMKPFRLRQYNPQELCNLIWASGRMSVQSVECQKSLAAELVKRRDVFDQFSAQGLASVVLGWAHGRFSRKEDSNVVLREVMKEDRLKQYNAQELANLCWSFGRLGIHSTNLYRRLANHMLQEKTLEAFTPQALANILVGWAHGRFRDLSAVHLVAQQFHGEKLTELKPQEIAATSWALGKLGYQSSDIVKRIALEAVRRETLKSLTPLQMSILLLGWSKSAMHDFLLWDRVLAEFSSRQETVSIDMPVLHNITLAVRLVGCKGLNDYRTAREKGHLVSSSKT